MLSPVFALPLVLAGAQVSQPIIAGESCDGRFPTAIAIVLDATIAGDDVTRLMCTGTLIAPDVVLTAAHCAEPKLLTGGADTVERADYYVTSQIDLIAFADNDMSPLARPADAVAVRELFPHEEFDITAPFSGVADVKDIALLVLDAPFEGVLPEVVINADEAAAIAVGAPVSFAGWGKQTADFPGPSDSVGLKQCGDAAINEVGASEMQIGDDGTRKCQGDSGGPTYLVLDNGEQRVVGVTSHQYDASGCTKGGVDTRVDAYLDWMEEKVPGVLTRTPLDETPPTAADDDDAPSCAASDATPFACALVLACVRVRRVRRVLRARR
jgi:hypothetical protein